MVIVMLYFASTFVTKRNKITLNKDINITIRHCPFQSKKKKKKRFNFKGFRFPLTLMLSSVAEKLMILKVLNDRDHLSTILTTSIVLYVLVFI